MGSADQQVSPEEKLLKVIQGGKPEAKPSPEEKMLSAAKQAPSPSPAPSPAPIPTPLPSVPAAAAPKIPAGARIDQTVRIPPQQLGTVIRPPKTGDAEKPKLKVLPTQIAQPKATPGAVQQAPAPDSAPPAPVPTKRLPVRRGKKRAGGSFSVGTLNIGLVAIILAILGFTAFEIWAGVTTKTTITPIDPRITALNLAESTGAVAMKDFPEMLKAFDSKIIFYVQGGPTSVVVGVSNMVVKTEVSELQKRVKLIGIGGTGGNLEAILVDAKDGNMHIVKSGQKFSIGDQAVELVEIQTDRAIVLLGAEKVVLSPGIVAATPAPGAGPVERRR